MIEFFNMGGHGFYIWISYGIVAVTLGYHYVAPIHRHKRLVQNLSVFYRSKSNRHPE